MRPVLHPSRRLYAPPARRVIAAAGVAILTLSLAVAPSLGAHASSPGAAAQARGQAPAGLPWMDTSLSPDQRADLLLAALTLDQKVAFMHGIGDDTGMGFVGDHTGAIPPMPAIGFPGIHFTDGPIGVRQGGEPATLMPAPVALAASWDPAMAQQYGTVLGSEAHAKNNDVIFGPMINMVRIPQGGRDFETLGEDPYLAARIAVPEIEAIQNQGVMADPKHYVANNQETDREVTNAIVDDRTLHEIYLPAFEASVEQAHAATVMAAYNKVNGAYNTQNCPLLHGVLEGQFGFDGFVVSDYDSTYGQEVPSVNCGTDVELPTGEGLPGLGGQPGSRATGGYDYLPQDVTAGTVLTSTIDAAVHRVLRTLFRFGVFDRQPCPIANDINNCSPIDANADGLAARQVAEAGAVLLKNATPQAAAAPLLPLDTGRVTSIAVIGPAAATNAQGGGSSATVPFTNVTPLQGITARAGPGIRVAYNDGSNAALAAAVAATSSVAIVVVADQMMEQVDRPCLDLNCYSSASAGGATQATDQDALIEAVAVANPHTIVVLNSGAPDLMPWIGQVPSVLESWYGGEENGAAMASVLFGDVNPSGKLPVTFPLTETDTAANTPQQYPGVGEMAHYSEGVFIGYRHYDQAGTTPLFPFGHGLSYTTFSYSNLAIAPAEACTAGAGATGTGPTRATVSFDVQNTGSRAGAEVAQLYLGFPMRSAVPEPPKWLRGFQKVFLQPGQITHVTLPVDQRALSYWDTTHSQWTVQPGPFNIMVGGSSRDIRLTGSMQADATGAVSNPSPPDTTSVATPCPPTATATATMTPVPPTATMLPASSATPIPATSTPVPPATTRVPATSTPVPPAVTRVPATATPVPATGTSMPMTTPTGKSTSAATATMTGGRTAAPAATTTAIVTLPGAVATAIPPSGTTPQPAIERPTIAVSPDTTRPGNTVTVTGRGFRPGETITLALNGAALLTRPTIVRADRAGRFTAVIVAPGGLLEGANAVSALGVASRVAALATLIGRLPVAAQFFFAGGQNTSDTQSVLQALNPNDHPANVTLTLYVPNGSVQRSHVTIAPHSQRQIPVATLTRRQGNVGLALTANVQVAAQLALTRPGRDGDAILGNTGLGTTWYLAEGYTGLTFHETVSILNPDARHAARVTLRLLALGGKGSHTVTVSAPAHSDTTVDVSRLLPGRSLSVVATSNRGVVVERTLSFSHLNRGRGASSGYGLTARAGINVAATSWLFAEGSTANHFETYLTVLNPGAATAHVTARFYGRAGALLGIKTIVVAGLSRGNIRLNGLVHASGIASTVMADQPVAVERPEYFGSPNGVRVAGSDVFGLNGGATRWSFAGGDTAGTSEFLLLYNPSAASIAVRVTFYSADGRAVNRQVTLRPRERATLDVRRLAPGLTAPHGLTLESMNGQGFVAEQTVFALDLTTLRTTQGLAQ